MCHENTCFYVSSEYKLEIFDKADDSVITFETLAAESSLILEESFQPGEYEARLSAYTQLHASPASNVTFQLGNSGRFLYHKPTLRKHLSMTRQTFKTTYNIINTYFLASL